jgi:hypothetical protein
VVVFVKLTHLFEIKHYGYIRGIIALIIKMETFDIELSEQFSELCMLKYGQRVRGLGRGKSEGGFWFYKEYFS